MGFCLLYSLHIIIHPGFVPESIAGISATITSALDAGHHIRDIAC